MFQFPWLATPRAYVFSPKLDRLVHLPGCPIRRSPDLRLLAATRSFSQLSTSFIASRHLGIHRAPFVA